MRRIGVIPGDGIGPEVVDSGMMVLDVLQDNFDLELDITEYDIGSERYLMTGELITEDEFEELGSLDAIYFGAIGDPRVAPGVLEKGVLLAMRARFDQYINLRPVRSWHPFVPLRADVDFEIDFLRENTEDFYMGIGGSISPDERTTSLAVDRRLYHLDVDVSFGGDVDQDFAFEMGILSRKGVERFARYAFEFAADKGADKVTLVDKANVCSSIYGFQREVFEGMSESYGIGLEYMFVDAMAMALVRRPETFSVVAVPNLFGDILTDLAAEVQGGIGLAASGNINPDGVSMFEPVHGSAPDIAGQGIANPFASLLALGMLLDRIGRDDLGDGLRSAISAALDAGESTGDLGGSLGTEGVTDAVIAHMLR